MTHLFGPVNSRRLGLSLGVDLIPRKTCPFDCIYCEVGPTTRRILQRQEYRTEEILAELEDYFRGSPPVPDFVTLAGSGEPTLNLGLGRIIKGIKRLTAAPVAVLTNGALLHLPEVRRELAPADVVLPSLDAGREQTFQAVNRPHPDLSLDLLLSGLKALREDFTGQIWLEIMVLKGINDREPELAALKAAIAPIAPDKVQLNTAVRPPAEDYALAVAPDELAAVAAYLGEKAAVIASYARSPNAPAAYGDADFLAALARRPMTARDLAQALGLPLAQVQHMLDHLKNHGQVTSGLHQHQVFFRCHTDADQP